MTTVKIEVDSRSGVPCGGGLQIQSSDARVRASAADKIGLVSSIPLDDVLTKGFLDGAGLTDNDIEFGVADSKNYDANKIIAKKDQHKGNGSKVIATVGGSFAFDAINSNNDTDIRFVSLVGYAPTTGLSRQFKGGVSLESFNSNPLRKAYVQNLAGGARYTPDNIFLYTNKSSKMHGLEKSNWGKDSTFLESSAGDGATNNPANFNADFTAAGINLPPITANPAAAKAIIISDDPFFRAYRDDLIKAVNTWLQGTDRYVIYPSQIYANTTGIVAPLKKQSTLFGPDLTSAMFLLGMLASYYAEHKNAPFSGFFSVPNSAFDIII
jgi:hypothetical protein